MLRGHALTTALPVLAIALAGPCDRAASSGSGPAASATNAASAASGSSPTTQDSASTAASAAPHPSSLGGTSSGLFRDVGPALFGIGGNEADQHSHVSFVTPHELIRARIRMRADNVSPKGLNFFAMQVNFKESNTWAHGGLQDVATKEGGRRRQANWGGLVNRGGGSGDYSKENDLADIDKIQNASGGQTRPYEWKVGEVYEYVIERGKEVTLPPGDYKFLDAHPAVHVDHPRKMWEWKFTARPEIGGEAFTEVLFDSAATISSFSVWNEHGHETTSDTQHTSWFGPEVRTVDAPAKDVAPSAWHRF